MAYSSESGGESLFMGPGGVFEGADPSGIWTGEQWGLSPTRTGDVYPPQRHVQQSTPRVETDEAAAFQRAMLAQMQQLTATMVTMQAKIDSLEQRSTTSTTMASSDVDDPTPAPPDVPDPTPASSGVDNPTPASSGVDNPTPAPSGLDSTTAPSVNTSRSVDDDMEVTVLEGYKESDPIFRSGRRKAVKIVHADVPKYVHEESGRKYLKWKFEFLRHIQLLLCLAVMPTGPDNFTNSIDKSTFCTAVLIAMASSRLQAEMVRDGVHNTGEGVWNWVEKRCTALLDYTRHDLRDKLFNRTTWDAGNIGKTAPKFLYKIQGLVLRIARDADQG